MNTYKLMPETLNFTIKISQNNTSDLHTHDFFEFIIVQSGIINHVTNNNEIELMQGDIVMLAPGITHSYYTKNYSSHYDILIRPSFFKSICDFLSDDLFNFYNRRKFVKNSISIGSLSEIDKQISAWQETIDISTKKILEKLITDNLISFILPEKNEHSDKSSFRELCLVALNRYYSLPDALKLIQDELGYNEIYLCRKFKQCFGCTMVEYINNLRLTYAGYLFKTKGISVSECVTTVGLNSLPYFNKIFKEKYGISPSKYRKLNSNR